MAIDGIIVTDGTERRRDADNPTTGDIFQYDGTNLVRIAVGSDNDVLRLNGAVAEWDTFLEKKSGRILVGSFSGNPRKATVTFAGAFGDANYAVTVTAVSTVSGQTYDANVENQLAGSFVINLGANQTTNLVQVNWVAVKDGETS